MITGAGEILVILALVAVFFGAGKLPELMGAVGASVREFNDGVEDGKSDGAPVDVADAGEETEDG